MKNFFTPIYLNHGYSAILFANTSGINIDKAISIEYFKIIVYISYF